MRILEWVIEKDKRKQNNMGYIVKDIVGVF
jgi:hypothetical protein